MRKRKILPIITTAALAGALLSGCGSTVSENTTAYFSNVRSILNILKPAAASSAATESSKASDKTELAAPTDYQVAEDGSYSFQGVENADYYVIYFYNADNTDENADFLYSSEAIQDTGTAGQSYSGKLSDIMKYAYGSYKTTVVAFPKLEDTDLAQSEPAEADFVVSGEVEDPEIDYFWNTFTDEMSLQLTNAANYEYEAWPEEVAVTFTNTEDASDEVTLSFTDLTSEMPYLSTTDLKKGETYDIEVETKTDNANVTNQDFHTTISDGLTLGGNNIMTQGYTGYSDGFIRDAFKFPRVAEAFSLKDGGSVGGAVGDFGYFEIEGTPESENTYSVYTKIYSWNVNGTMKMYDDGTFAMKISGEGPIVNGYIKGIWRENEGQDGIVTLSYDGSSVVIGADVEAIEL